MKAKEIVEKYYMVITENRDHELNVKRAMWEQAKECAIMEVDACMEMAHDYNATEDGRKVLGEKHFKDYWQQLKAEIEKMI